MTVDRGGRDEDLRFTVRPQLETFLHRRRQVCNLDLPSSLDLFHEFPIRIRFPEDRWHMICAREPAVNPAYEQVRWHVQYLNLEKRWSYAG